MEISKRDWKLFKDKIGAWQETYMEKLVGEYMTLLKDNMTASSKFWELEKRIKQDKKKPGVMIDLSRPQMLFNIVHMINDGAITMDDLLEFSDELRDKVRFLLMVDGVQ